MNSNKKCKDYIKNTFDSIYVKQVLKEAIEKHLTCPDCKQYLESYEELSAHPYGDHIKWKECPKCKKKFDFKVLT